MTDFGIDISHYNRVDNWQAVRGNNITFVSVKLTESTGFSDRPRLGHVDRARAAGIHAGGYHFARRTPICRAGPALCRPAPARSASTGRTLSPRCSTWRPPSCAPGANPFVADFIAGLRSATGIRRMLRVREPRLVPQRPAAVGVARRERAALDRPLQRQSGNPGFAHPSLALHQHTDRGRVPGIPGNVDRDATLGATGWPTCSSANRDGRWATAAARGRGGGRTAGAAGPGRGRQARQHDRAHLAAGHGDDISYRLYEDRSPDGGPERRRDRPRRAPVPWTVHQAADLPLLGDGHGATARVRRSATGPA